MKTKPIRSFTKNSLAQVAFPLGGIGTGTISLGGRGNLQDWEIFNRPNKNSFLPMTFFALRAAVARVPSRGVKSKTASGDADYGPVVSRILERAYLPPFTGAHGFPRHALSGVSRFQEVIFRGEYPFAWLDFLDEKMPVQVSLEAFNPFIPMNVEDSSIPCAILRYTVKNTRRSPVNVSLLAVMRNPIGFQTLESERKIEETLNSYREEMLEEASLPVHQRTKPRAGTPVLPRFRGIHFTAPGLPDDDINFGTAALTTDHAETDFQTHLFRGGWWDAAHVLWDEFTATGRLTPCLDDVYGRTKSPILTIEEQIAGAQGRAVSVAAASSARKKYRDESAAMCLVAELQPGESKTFSVFIHWHFPNARLWGKEGAKVRTFVGNQFADAWDAARYTHANFTRLESETRQWHETFFSSTLPAEVLDAVSSQMSIIRTQTVMRLSDGKIYAWEGCGDEWGCCAGNCTHVWNYEQALAFLFPSLERTMRQIDFGPSMKPNGAMAFRCAAPGGTMPVGWNFHACGDGQMGNVMQAYREWQLSGDDSFLREIWHNVKKALEFAWGGDGSTGVPACDLWDVDKDGVMEGCQHNTYDIEFYGPNPLMGVMYLGALRAAEEMALHLGELQKAREYRGVYESGRAKLEKQLWNGDYFVQQVEVMKGLELPEHLRSPISCETGCDCKPERESTAEAQRAQSLESKSASAASSASLRLIAPSESNAIPKYQHGEGCLSDQLLGQFLAHVVGLGHVIDPAKSRKTMQAIFKHNFRDKIGGYDNVQRTYALQDEAGLLLCTWPRGNRPAIPFPYSDEVWTGIEYQVAAHLIYEGCVPEGLAIVKAARARHDGIRRNPWNDFECGWHYARALSSWALIQALSGVRYSAVEQSLTFDPKLGASRSVVTMTDGGRDGARPSKSNTTFTSVFTAGSAWGLLRVEKNKATLEVRHGKLTLKKFGATANPQTFSAPKQIAVGESASISLRR